MKYTKEDIVPGIGIIIGSGTPFIIREIIGDSFSFNQEISEWLIEDVLRRLNEGSSWRMAEPLKIKTYEIY